MKHQNFSFCYAALTFILYIVIFSSCGTKRDIVYFQNSNNISEASYGSSNNEYRPEIMPNDNLFITVSAVNPESVEVFNTIAANRGGNLTTASLDMFGYLVDLNGNINIPLVGEIRVAGLTKMAAVQLLQKEISRYVNNPIVNIRFLNYKINVIGEVNRPGVYTITDEKISIPQAIALAGDLTVYGERRNVQLIRVEKGEKKFYYFDLTSPNLFFSPHYYLHQNDILYIAPNGTKAGSSTYNANLPLFVSLISVTITAFALFLR